MRRGIFAATLVLAALATDVAAPAVRRAGGAVQDSVAAASSVLEQRSAQRREAEEVERRARAAREEAHREIVALGDHDRELVEQVAQQRRAVRHYVVAAYIDGGNSSVYATTIDEAELDDVMWRTTVARQQAEAAEGAARALRAVREELGAEQVAAGIAADEADRAATAATYDLIQAAAHERDAEAALVDARREAEERRRAEVAAAEARAAARSAAVSADPTSTAGSASASTGSAAASGEVASTSSARRGDPTSSELATLAKIRHCESRGNYSIVSASGRYRGAYQFDRRTWGGVGGSGDPAAATPEEQDYRALLLLRMRGTRPWPVCGR